MSVRTTGKSNNCYMAEKNLNVHDNLVLSYEVNCARQRIIIHTCCTDRNPPYEYTDIVFEGVVAYKFRNDWLHHGNILLDIERVDLSTLIGKYAAEFHEGIQQGWPPVGPFDTIPQLTDILKALGVAGFEISSSCGLAGLVISRNVEFAIGEVRG